MFALGKVCGWVNWFVAQWNRKMNGCLGVRTAGWTYTKTNVDVGRKLTGLREKIAGMFNGDMKCLDAWLQRRVDG